MMDDLISRKEALKVCEKYNGQGYVWSCIRGDIERLPSVKLERKIGEWIYVGHQFRLTMYRCSECGELNIGESNFCPNCGTKMDDDDIPMEYFENGGI